MKKMVNKMKEYERELEHVMKEFLEELLTLIGTNELDQLLVNLAGRLCYSEYYDGYIHNIITEIANNIT